MSKSSEKIDALILEDSAADKLFRQTFLFDFYGELLNEHQRSIYEAYVSDNFSISEIAQENNVSRQSVHDLIRRCDSILETYEARLHLIERFQVMKQDITNIQQTALKAKSSDEIIKIREICEKLLHEL